MTSHVCFSCILIVHLKPGSLVGVLPEESDQFRFLYVDCLTNLKDSVGLILAKDSGMSVTIPIELSTWSFIPLPHFFHSRSVPLIILFPQRSF